MLRVETVVSKAKSFGQLAFCRTVRGRDGEAMLENRRHLSSCDTSALPHAPSVTHNGPMDFCARRIEFRNSQLSHHAS